MCGIAGSAGGVRWDEETVTRVQERLRHRGPEGEGAWRGETVDLVHTRLRIIDPSDAGRQPMWTGDGRYALVYNGEVYNYRELRDRLIDRGHSFRSETDTEVVAEAWAEWGPASLGRLEGIFALAVWDRDRSQLFLARDRMGVKPLYWCRDPDGRICFASEIRALLAAGEADGELAPGVLSEFLLQGTVATPGTIVRDVRMLPPGSRMTVRLRDGRALEPEIDRFRGSPEGSEPPTRRQDPPISPAAARRELASRLRAAVDRQRVSDVPLGAFLSGGLDSTAIVALLAEVADAPVSTFTVVSEEADYADRDHARLVAERFETSHREIELSDEELAAQVPGALDAQDHPSGDGVNTYIVARAAREAGLKVALSGLGADELFGGYPTFDRLRHLSRVEGMVRATPPAIRRNLANLMRGLSRDVRVRKTADLLETSAGAAETYPILRSVFPPTAVGELLAEGGRDAPSTKDEPAESRGWRRTLEREFAGRPDLTAPAQAALAECVCYMHDVLLRDTDQMSMASSLEVRVPFLDDSVVTYVRGLPDRIRFSRRATPKALLAGAMANRIPEAVRHRPKRPFALPFDRWMRGPLRELCQEGLDAAAAHPALDADAIREVWRGFLAGDRGIPWKRPWLLVSLGRWLEKEGIS